MISISSIKTYMFCPLQLYIQYNLDIDMNTNYIMNKTLKELRIDIKDLLQRNIRRIRKDMSLSEIEEELNKNIFSYIENTINSLKNNEKYNNESINYSEKESSKEIEKIKYELIEETEFNIEILSLKALKVMKTLNSNGNEIVEIFFPISMYSYLIRDPQLGIIGSTDKIEIINGKYYPITIKNSTPPLQGAWDSDTVELVANALLIEQEFDTEVFVGFVEYLKINERRPVVMDANLRKSLFKVLNDMKNILINKEIPNINININKCENCDYNQICERYESEKNNLSL